MLRLVKPLAAVLVVPILCTALALASRSQWDARWLASLRWQAIMRRQAVDERLIARYSLARLCADPRTASSVRPCRAYNMFTSTANASYGVGVVGVVFLGAILGAGWVCRSSRSRLVSLFKPALLVTVSGLVVLVILHGALGVAGLFLLGEVVERWPIYIVLALVVATVFVAISMIQVAVAVTRKARVSVVGRSVDLAAEPRLARWLDETATAMGARRPDRVVCGLSPAVFMTDATVVCLDGEGDGTLYLSLPLARILSVEEYRALLGHELGHFQPAAAALTSRFYPLYVGARRAVEALARRGRGIGSIVIQPALWVLSLFTESFAGIERAVARQREIAADQAAAALTSPETYASALVKVHAFAPAWETVRSAMARAVLEGMQYVNASALFAEVAEGNAVPERLAGVGTRSLWHPIDSLPPLGARLEALGIKPSDVAVASLVTRPATPAATLFQDCEAMELGLSEVEHRLLEVGRLREGGDGADEPRILTLPAGTPGASSR